jgi:hypothetical protein
MKVEFYDCPFCGELGVQTGHGCKEKTNLFKAVKTPKPEETRGMSDKCFWEYDDTYDYWETSCGHAFCLEIGGTPIEHEFKFCMYCGKLLLDEPQEGDAGNE